MHVVLVATMIVAAALAAATAPSLAETVTARSVSLPELWRAQVDGDRVISMSCDDDGMLYVLGVPGRDVRVYDPQGNLVDTRPVPSAVENRQSREISVWSPRPGVLGFVQQSPTAVLYVHEDSPLPTERISLALAGRPTHPVWCDANLYIQFSRKTPGGSESVVQRLNENVLDGPLFEVAFDGASPYYAHDVVYDQPRWTVAPDGAVFCSLVYDRYDVVRIGPDGARAVYCNDPSYKHRARDRAEVEAISAKLRTLQPDAEVRRHHRDIEALFHAGPHTLLVATSAGSRNAERLQLDVFRDGDLVGRADLEIPVNAITDRIFFSGSQLFVAEGAAPNLLSKRHGSGTELVCYDASALVGY